MADNEPAEGADGADAIPAKKGKLKLLIEKDKDFGQEVHSLFSNDLIRKLINQKYWMARIPFLWSKDNVYLELEAS